MREFFGELKRRRVYKVAVLYAAVAWVMVQIADVVLENFNVPERGMQGVILLAAIGFPIALVLAWVYDMTPQGIERTLPADAKSGLAGDDRPGIAVLPFDNLSGDPQDEITSSGFTEDLTTLLARITGFFVISRNSAYVYKDQTVDVREIGRQLGVRYLLEGSLRRMGDRVRVTAQLIETESGSHLWADNYDTGIDDLFQAQDALLRDIASRLGVELARAEFKLAHRKSHSDHDAWSLYQQAKGTMMFQGWSENAVTEAGALLRRAIALDPDCGAPHAYLALLLSLGRMIKLVEDPQAAHDESLAAAERALELDSNSSEVLGYAGCALSDLGYAQRGIPIINKAIELDPSNAQALAALGAAQVVSGELEAGIAELSKAIKISPRDPGLALWATILSIGCGYSSQSQEASRWAELALKSDARFFPGMIALAWSHTVEGRLEEAQTALNNAKQQYPRLDSQYITDLIGAGVLLRMQEAGLSFAERQQPTA